MANTMDMIARMMEESAAPRTSQNKKGMPKAIPMRSQAIQANMTRLTMLLSNSRRGDGAPDKLEHH